ncbi:MAG TPA: hypothetical protein VFK86_19770, partial [Bauldia sp.]|nr:hypothetical protein [Bauldia sp.]
EGMEDSDLVVNWRGERSRGWGGWAENKAEVAETFRFACPSNPEVRAKTLARLAELLARYPFTGVFLDKIRFPSPANGLEEVASCFCVHCRQAAREAGLDLDAVAHLLEDGRAMAAVPARQGFPSEWLWTAVAGQPLLSRFLRFRMDVITGLAAEAHDLVKRHGAEIGFDLFSPGLAPLVGQDYAALSRLAAWIKPMSYRVAEGPAGLRLEIPALVDGISRMFGAGEAEIIRWAVDSIPGFTSDTLNETRKSAVPLTIITNEIKEAVRLASPVPVYFGLELVSHPGVIEITPQLVKAMVNAGRAADAAGAFISWDLVHSPREGIRALAEDLGAAG